MWMTNKTTFALWLNLINLFFKGLSRNFFPHLMLSFVSQLYSNYLSTTQHQQRNTGKDLLAGGKLTMVQANAILNPYRKMVEKCRKVHHKLLVFLYSSSVSSSRPPNP
jgi:hypothetical protein